MSANKKDTPKSGDVLFIPLNKLKKSPKNVRKTPHAKADIEALAASIAAKGLLQNLVVEPEHDKKGRATGCYLVTIGEGRRLAQLLRAKRKQITKTEPIRCVLDTEHSAEEISLAENVIRSDMHPADQYEAFAQLHGEQGMAAEDIAARFGVTPAVVRQRLKLAAVSPALIEVYRDGDMTLEQLTAFTVTDNHVKQERVWETVGWNNGRQSILRALREGQVAADDRRAVFVGIEAYEAAGGALARDLFDEEGGGYLVDAELLNRMVREKLQTTAQQVVAEGWKWVTVEPEYDYQLSAGMRRLHPLAPSLTDEQRRKVEELEAAYGALLDQANEEDDQEASEEIAAKLQGIEADIIALTGGERYRPEDIAYAGAFVALGCEGEARIERGFVRREDEPRPENGREDRSAAARENAQGGDQGPAPLSEKLIAELTAHRTAALRNELAGDPETALIALVHALAVGTFYGLGETFTCLEIPARSAHLSGHAPGIDETPAMNAIAERHHAWLLRIPEDAAELWRFIVALDSSERLQLMAHCASLSVNAVRAPGTRSGGNTAHADTLARAVGLDMAAYWQPTVQSYFGRVSKERILDAVREYRGDDAAQHIAGKKKQAMAKAAEDMLSMKGWLPEVLRTPAAPEADDAETS